MVRRVLKLRRHMVYHTIKNNGISRISTNCDISDRRIVNHNHDTSDRYGTTLFRN